MRRSPPISLALDVARAPSDPPALVMHRAAVLSAILALAAACGSPCEDLANRICGCQPQGTMQDACKQQVKQQLSVAAQKPTASDESHCSALLSSCNDPGSDPAMCDRLQTEKGKIDCGLAYDGGTP